MPLIRVASFERVAELQAECMADDIPVDENMLLWTEQQVLSYFESGGQQPREPAYPRVWLTSDVHTDREENMVWVRSLPARPDDAIIVAGDVSHQMEQLEATLRGFGERFAHVFFAAGNHDLWITRADGEMDSLAKLDAIDRMCERLGNVYTTPRLLRANGSTSGTGDGLWVVPLQSWYDNSLDLTLLSPSLSHRAGDMRTFTWSDFALCKWPASLLRPADTITGLYPSGVATRLAQRNEPAIRRVNEALREGVGDAIVSFSHFLPREETLPDWLEPSSSDFLAEWVSHPAGCTAVKFSKVAGSRLIDAQLRQLTEGVRFAPGSSGHACRQVHAFGHSHRPKDFSLEGVRYVSHPLGYAKERLKGLTPAEPHLKLVWDVDGAGPLPSRPLIRYWEDHGGCEPGLDALLTAPPPAARAGGMGGGMRRNQTWSVGTGSMEAAAAAPPGIASGASESTLGGFEAQRAATAARRQAVLADRRQQAMREQQLRAQRHSLTTTARSRSCAMDSAELERTASMLHLGGEPQEDDDLSALLA